MTGSLVSRGPRAFQSEADTILEVSAIKQMGEGVLHLVSHIYHIDKLVLI